MNSTVIKIIAPLALLGALVAPTLAAPPLHPGSVDARMHDQHARIQQGIHSGQLTRHETADLRAREARIHNQTARDRARNGGHLTAGEHRRIEHEQNRTSTAIYRQKHDAQHRP